MTAASVQGLAPRGLRGALGTLTILRRLARRPEGLIGLVILAIFIVLAIAPQAFVGQLQTAVTATLVFNARLDAAVTGIFLVLVATILIDSVRVWAGILGGTRAAKTTETPLVATRLAEEL